MSEQHTPGPWVPLNDDNYVGESFTTPKQGLIGEWHDFTNKKKANARLIAAAPDLLEACKNMKDRLSDYCQDLDCTPFDEMAAADAAIAKATRTPATPRNPSDAQSPDDTGDRHTGDD